MHMTHTYTQTHTEKYTDVHDTHMYTHTLETDEAHTRTYRRITVKGVCFLNCGRVVRLSI